MLHLELELKMNMEGWMGSIFYRSRTEPEEAYLYVAFMRRQKSN